MFLLDRPNLGPYDGPGGVSLGAGRGQNGVAGEPGGRKISNLVRATISHHFVALMNILDRFQVRLHEPLHGPVHGLPHLRQGEAAPVANGGGGGCGGAVGGVGDKEEQEEQGQLC